jgi:hypothetical protein
MDRHRFISEIALIAVAASFVWFLFAYAELIFRH